MAQKKFRDRKAKPVTPEKGPRSGLLWGGAGAVAVAISGALLYFLSVNPHPRLESGASSDRLPEREGKTSVILTAGETGTAVITQFVGSHACVSCHAKEYEEWRKSQHHDAMAQANEQSVLGDFNNAKFNYAGVTSSFFKRDGKCFVNTDGPGGKLADFEIKYTFGVYPLQQYLIEFPDGRLQALSIAWDARSKKAGGQRWFHLYPKERISYDEELHWTRPSQNWNFMCADCHSTDVRKNYDAAADKFQTRWAEINVGCEACHGPGSRHLEWTKSERSHRTDNAMGLRVSLDERRGVTWSVNPATGNAALQRRPGGGAGQPRNLLRESRRWGERRKGAQGRNPSGTVLCSRLRESCRPVSCHQARPGWRADPARGSEASAQERDPSPRAWAGAGADEAQ